MKCFPDFITRYYKQNVSQEFSTIKIADEVPREEEMTVDTVNFTAKLEDTFKENAKNDDFLRWHIYTLGPKL